MVRQLEHAIVLLLDVGGKFLPHELGKVSIDPTGLSEKPMRIGEGLNPAFYNLFKVFGRLCLR